MSESLIYQRDGSVVVVQLHRPERKNALSAALRQELRERLNAIAQDRTIRAVIVTGGEDFFCAGADIVEISADSKNVSGETEYNRARDFQTLFDQIEALPQPVIAAVAGFAFGGGCELVLACDFRLAAENAVFGLTEVRVGAFPAGGGTQRLPRLIGTAKAKEMILTGEPVKAAQALALGLVSKVVPQGKLLEEARNFACKFAALPRLSVETAKMLINRGSEMELASALQLEARCAGIVGTSHDFREGFLAFLEKRKPAFTGN